MHSCRRLITRQVARRARCQPPPLPRNLQVPGARAARQLRARKVQPRHHRSRKRRRNPQYPLRHLRPALKRRCKRASRFPQRIPPTWLRRDPLELQQALVEVLRFELVPQSRVHPRAARETGWHRQVRQPPQRQRRSQRLGRMPQPENQATPLTTSIDFSRIALRAIGRRFALSLLGSSRSRRWSLHG